MKGLTAVVVVAAGALIWALGMSSAAYRGRKHTEPFLRHLWRGRWMLIPFVAADVALLALGVSGVLHAAGFLLVAGVWAALAIGTAIVSGLVQAARGRADEAS